MSSQAGKKAMRKSRATALKNSKRNNDEQGGDKNQGNNWKKKMKKALKTPHGLKTVMSVLAEEEKTNQGFASALNNSSASTLPPAPLSTPPVPPTPPPQAQASALQAAFPSTSVKLQSILRNNK
jgi:hypothetical protein